MTTLTKTSLMTGLAAGLLAIGISAEQAVIGQEPEPSAESPIEADATDPHPVSVINRARLWDRKRRSAREVKLERSLQEVTEVEFADNPLEEGLNYLEDLHHIEIQIDRPALQDEGIPTDAPVTLKLSGVPLKSAMELLLEPLGLDYLIKNDVVMITTRKKADSTREVRVYDISRLRGITTTELEEIIRSTVAPETWSLDRQKSGSVAAATMVPTPGVKGTGSPNESTHASERTTAGTEEAVAPPNTVPGTPASNTARDAAGAIRYTANSLIIRQSRRVHEEIVDLLDQLERSGNNRAEPVSNPAVTRDDYSR